MHSIHDYVIGITAVCYMLVMYDVKITATCRFLNQARAWFLEIAFVREVSMRVCVCVDVCVCVRPRGHE